MARGLSEEGNATELVSVKVFTSKYVWKELELTTVDLLRKVPRITVPDKPAQVLTQAERERVLECFDRPTFEDVRNRALVACYMATGLRFKEVLNLRLDDVDRVTGDIVVLAKGGKVRPARLSPRALKYVREYIKARPRVAADRLWLMADGRELTVFAARAVFTRLKKRSGIPRLKAHLLRHGFAQAALAAGAHPGLVQDMLGHTTAVMTRRYLGWEKATQAAKAMPQYAPI